MERRIELEGCHNFRDLGGYPTRDGRRLRWRRLFRSDSLHHLSALDVTLLRDELGLRAVVDLRSSPELAMEGRGLLEESEPRVAFHHLPLFDGDTTRARDGAGNLTLADTYFLLAEYAKEPIARAIRVLSDCEGAAVYHCAAGKDRTGLLSALLLGLLGVSDELIVADYALSQENMDAIVERLNRLEGYRAMWDVLPPDTLHAQPETMMGLLERISDNYGSMRAYALSAGLDPPALACLEEALLVEA